MYELTIADPAFVKMITHLYSIHMELIKKWGDYSDTTCSMGENPNLFHYLPEGFLFDIMEIVTAAMKINPRYALAFTPDFVSS